ncbi:MAG: hypothetical protein QXH27_06045 [Candidatus Micrarchaeia archaeon]
MKFLLLTTTLGSFTRPDYLIQAIRGFGKGEVSAGRLEALYRKATRDVLRAQANAGIDIPTDGQLRWDDIITFFAGSARGFELNGLIRFFDNNLYYRKPVCKGALVAEPVAVESYRIARRMNRSVKPVITGPFTLADLSENKFYKSKREFVLALAELVGKERTALEGEGAPLIQIDEPSLVNRRLSGEEWDIASEALEAALKGAKAKIFLATYFGSVRDALPRLLDLPVFGIGIDCISVPENEREVLARAKDFGEKSVGFGCIDARNTRMEDAGKVAARAVRLCRRFPPEKVLLHPSAGLEFLPYTSSVAKLKLLAHAARLARKEVS